MENLQIIFFPNSHLTLQKCYLSKDIIKKQDIQIGSFILVELNCGINLICQCYNSPKHDGNFSEIDSSVKQLSQKKQNLIIDQIIPENALINEIKKVSVVKFHSVKVSIVVKNFTYLDKFKKELKPLKNILHEFLTLFIFSQNCVINFKDLQKFGIELIIIDEVNGNNENIIGKIFGKTKIEISKILTKFSYEKFSKKEQGRVFGGLKEPFEKLANIINSLQKNLHTDKHSTNKVLITGPSGCGKTSLIKFLTEKLNLPLYSVSGSDFIDSQPGESEKQLKNIFDEAQIFGEELEDITIILLDEIDSICPKDQISQNHAAQRICFQLYDLLDHLKPNILFIGISNSSKQLDPALLRPGLLDEEISISVPTQEEREDILRILVPWVSFTDIIARLTPGYIGADLELLCQKVIEMKVQGISHTKAQFEDFHKVLSLMKPASVRTGLGLVLSKPQPLSSLGGLNEVKKILYHAIQMPLQNSEAFIRLGLSAPRGILLYGPPGCAKTSLAHAIASEAGCTFLSVSAADLYSPYVGEAEQKVVELFERARAASPAVIFIDEIDALVGNRGESNQIQGVNHRVLSAFLTEMDGIHDTSQSHTIVIAATNRPNALDTAILRPGRFDRTIFVPPPDRLARRDILSILTRSSPLSEKINLDIIAERTERYSGADLSALVREASFIALMDKGMDAKQIEVEHMEKALNKVKSSLSELQIKDDLSS